ncbi:MAG: hypothetical protein QOD04_258, partial [Pseudonocardiales bacterium]|nr:hypothetical protein [Pseudonocardiales bacterium]
MNISTLFPLIILLLFIDEIHRIARPAEE